MNVKHKVQSLELRPLGKELYIGDEYQKNRAFGIVISLIQASDYSRLSDSRIHNLLTRDYAISLRDVADIHRNARLTLFAWLQTANLPRKANNLLSARERQKNALLIERLIERYTSQKAPYRSMRENSSDTI